MVPRLQIGRERTARNAARFIAWVAILGAAGALAFEWVLFASVPPGSELWDPNVTSRVPMLTRSIVEIALLIALAITAWLQSRPRHELWSISHVAVGAGFALLVGQAQETTAEAVALMLVAGVAVPASSFILASRARLLPLGWALAAISTIIAAFSYTLPVLIVLGRSGSETATASAIAGACMSFGGWLAGAMLIWWLDRAVANARLRISELGASHLAERLGSERDAQRHRDARLLHDTVLATLTLVSHGGRGLDPDVLQRQAQRDAELLRTLREQGADHGGDQGSDQILDHSIYGRVHRNTNRVSLEAARDSSARPSSKAAVSSARRLPLPTHELLQERLHERFTALGLSIEWHGTAELPQDGPAREALIGAIGECLENVRRHSGTNSCQVTVGSDHVAVRVTVSDSGTGFNSDPENWGFGLRESVSARIADVNGSVRVHTRAGAGTLVVLEVPLR